MSSRVTNITKITTKLKKIDIESLKSYAQYLVDKSANQIKIGCSKKDEGAVITETD